MSKTKWETPDLIQACVALGPKYAGKPNDNNEAYLAFAKAMKAEAKKQGKDEPTELQLWNRLKSTSALTAKARVKEGKFATLEEALEALSKVFVYPIRHRAKPKSTKKTVAETMKELLDF